MEFELVTMQNKPRIPPLFNQKEVFFLNNEKNMTSLLVQE
jgi:hypothetical protein